MSTVIVIIVAALIVGMSLIHRGWVKSELELLHNRLDAANSEVLIMVKNVKDKAQNAQAIASNALSSAQRAESRIVKHVETKEVSNA